MTPWQRIEKASEKRNLTIRGLAKELAARYGKSEKVWRRQLHKWKDGMGIGPLNAKRLATVLNIAPADIITEPALRKKRADELRALQELVEAGHARLAEVEGEIGALREQIGELRALPDGRDLRENKGP